MKGFVVALWLLGGCSLVTARATNNPRTGCSRTTARIDGAFALLGLVGMAAAITLYNVDPPTSRLDDHGNSRSLVRVTLGTTLILTVVEGVQAMYGFDVARRCREERAKLMGPASP
jgi:hypothetical protein